MKFLETFETIALIAAALGIFLFFKKNGAKPLEAIHTAAKELLPPQAVDTHGNFKSVDPEHNGHTRLWDMVQNIQEQVNTLQTKFVIYDEKWNIADRQRYQMQRTLSTISGQLASLLVRRRSDRTDEGDHDDT